jgi:APA family basic amino acid/polyamine antiporter
MTSLSHPSDDPSPIPRAKPLTRILGLGFGVAVIFGGTVGVGILRLPGMIAGDMRSFWPILLIWIIGGSYALLGANAISELGTAMPQAGGFYIYSKRAFGPAAGFAMGWADWLNNCAVVAFGSVAAAEYLAVLFPQLLHAQTPTALALLFIFCALQWNSLRISSSVQQIASSITAITFVVLAVACLLHHATILPASPTTPPHAGTFLRGVVPLVAALRAVVVTYDGWYEAIYFTEEDTNAAKHLPRAMIGGVILVLGLYLLMNIAFLHVLSIPTLAASTLPAADAARLVFPAGSATFVTVLSLLTLLSLINAVLLGAPRILLAIGRDGLFSSRAAQVAQGGTPRIALMLSAAVAALLISTGKLDDILAVAAILVAAIYSVNYIAVFVLRAREPDLPRPYRAWGHPLTTGLVLAASLAFLLADVHDDPYGTLRAAALLLLALPVYAFMRSRSRAEPIAKL